MLEFNVDCHSEPGQIVAVVGSWPLCGWDTSKCMLLDLKAYPRWSGSVYVGLSDAIEFKYILVSSGGPDSQLVRWEADGPNRRADPGSVSASKLIMHHVFGDLHRSAVEVIGEDGTPIPNPDAKNLTFNPPETAKSSPVSTNDRSSAGDSRTGASSESKQEPVGAEGVLDSLEVEASLRFGRLISSADAFADKYQLKAQVILGTGMSGGVVVAKDRRTDMQVAVKTLSTEGHDGEALKQVLAEVENQLAMDHPNICRLLEVFEEPGQLRLVMECMRGPDLFVHLARKGKYTERDAAGCVRQMCSAVAYCHRRGVCHRDLKLENVCLEDDTEDARVKLIDFGLSASFQISVPMTNACGTLYYVAPEVLRQKYDKKCDMWSLGVITYILLDGRAPFYGKDDRTTYQLIRRGSFSFPPQRWCHISAEARRFVSDLLRVDVNIRMDAEQALAHVWLAAASLDTEAPAQLDASVLQGLRAFTRSNALKQGVLRAVTNIATPEQVTKWANQFESIDEDGTGEVSVEDLAKSLVEMSNISEIEAEELASALADAQGELVSYSAFLAACLSAHVTMDQAEMRVLFARLDVGSDGKVSVDDVCKALGDIVDAEALQNDFGDGGLTYNDFRWLMCMPQLGPTKLGLEQLLGAYSGLTSSWKSSTRQAKAKGDGNAMEASRRENMAWRLWNQQRVKGEVEDGGPSSQRMEKQKQSALSLESLLLSRGLVQNSELDRMSTEEKREAIATDLEKKGLGCKIDLLKMSESALLDVAALPQKTSEANMSEAQVANTIPRINTLTLVSEALDRNLEDNQAAWMVATTEAKDGDVDAARRENMHWRKMNMKQPSEPSVSQVSFRVKSPEQVNSPRS